MNNHNNQHQLIANNSTKIEIEKILDLRIHEIKNSKIRDRNNILKILELEKSILENTNTAILEIEKKIFNIFKKTAILSKVRDLDERLLWHDDVHKIFIEFLEKLNDEKIIEAIDQLVKFRMKFGAFVVSKDMVEFSYRTTDDSALHNLDLLIDSFKIKYYKLQKI